MPRQLIVMPRKTFFALLIAGCMLGFSSRNGHAVPLTAAEILNKVDDLYRGASSHGKMKMEVVTAHWTRALSLEIWSKGKDKSLIRILAPLKDKGTSTLRSGNDIWNFLPKVNRVIKLPSSMMSASWMGSHFTNDDLVKESRFTKDYDFEITKEEAKKGERVVEITCMPKPEAPVVWGKVEVDVRLSDYLPLNIRYYDEGLHLARTMTFSNFRVMSGRELPATMILIPADKPGEKTELDYDDISFDVSLRDEFFSLRTLQE